MVDVKKEFINQLKYGYCKEHDELHPCWGCDKIKLDKMKENKNNEEVFRDGSERI